MYKTVNGKIDPNFMAKVWDKLIESDKMQVSQYNIERVLEAAEQVMLDETPTTIEEALTSCTALQSRHIHRLIRSLAKIEKALEYVGSTHEDYANVLTGVVEDEIDELKKEGFVIELREVREGTK